MLGLASKTSSDNWNGWIGRASDIAEATWHYNGVGLANDGSDIAALLIWKGCGAYESGCRTVN